MGAFEHEKFPAEQALQVENLARGELPVYGVVLGALVGFDNERTALVTYPQQTGSAAVPALSIIELSAEQLGSSVVLQFQNGNPTQPIIMGVIKNQTAALAESTPQVELDADGKRLLLTAKNELILKCGKASIHLTKEGKILLRGEYISSQSNGMNRLKGGSVQIN